MRDWRTTAYQGVLIFGGLGVPREGHARFVIGLRILALLYSNALCFIAHEGRLG